MAFPIVAGRASGRTGATNTTSHPITLPDGVQVNDLLVVWFAVDGSPNLGIGSGSVAWFIMDQTAYSTTVKGALFIKVASGTGDSLTVVSSASEQSSHLTWRLDGSNVPDGGWELTVATASTGSGSNSNPPIHFAPASADHLWLALRAGDSTVVPSAGPAGYTDFRNQAAAGTAGASASAAELFSTGDTEDPGAFTVSFEQWVCNTVAISATFTDGGTDTDPPAAPTNLSAIIL